MSHTQIDETHKMHTLYCENLDILKKQNKKDWDFKILFSGDGMTRTGKSTIASQTAHYLDPTFAKNWKQRVVFSGEELTKVAYKIGTNKAIVYDEAREGLDSKRQMEKYTKNLLDFFSQCGNLNHYILLVLPEFFELPKSIAITQSIYLVNCYARDGFNRGFFEFYNRKDKRYLYIKGQRFLDYKAQDPSFEGTFNNWMPFDRVEYEKLKTEALKKLQDKENPTRVQEERDIHKNRVKLLVNYLRDTHRESMSKIAEHIGIARTTLYEYLGGKRLK